MTNIRSKGTKTDEELVIELRALGSLLIWSPFYVEGYRDRHAAVIKELGKDRFDFLSFKIETEKRLENLEKPKARSENFDTDMAALISFAVLSLTLFIITFFFA